VISPILAKVPDVAALLNLPVSLAFFGLMMLLLYDPPRILPTRAKVALGRHDRTTH
jgi:hypothetical protein